MLSSSDICTIYIVCIMVLILDRNSEHVAHARRKGLYGEKKNRFMTVLGLIKCLKQIKYQILLLTCAPISELPSDTIAMYKMHFLYKPKRFLKDCTKHIPLFNISFM